MFALINKIPVPENKVLLAKINRRENSNHTCLYTKTLFYIQTHKHTNIHAHTHTHNEKTVFAFFNKIIVPENTVILAKLNRRDDSNHTCLYTKKINLHTYTQTHKHTHTHSE